MNAIQIESFFRTLIKLADDVQVVGSAPLDQTQQKVALPAAQLPGPAPASQLQSQSRSMGNMLNRADKSLAQGNPTNPTQPARPMSPPRMVS